MDQHLTPDRTAEPVAPEAAFDRRSFVRFGAAAAVATAGVGLITGEADAQGAGGNAVPNLFPNWAGREFRGFQRHENAHVAQFLVEIQRLGGTPRPRPTFRGLLQPNVRAFATVAQALENTGTGAYAGATPVVFSRQVLAFAASVALIEARHSGWINSLFNQIHTVNVFGQEQNFERPLTQQEVINLASPFIQNLNGGPPLAFAATPSRRNDIDILNFALALEYLEQDFYNLNVPRFFPNVQ